MDKIRLARNEQQIEHHHDVLSVKIENRDLCLYPDAGYSDSSAGMSFLSMLGQYVGAPARNLFLVNGSTDGLRLMVDCYLESGDEVLGIYPTYVDMLEFILFRGAVFRSVVKVGVNDLESLGARRDKDKLFDGYVRRGKTKMIYICSPNNPLSFSWHPEEIERLCTKYPDVMVFVDEAYYEFRVAKRVVGDERAVGSPRRGMENQVAIMAGQKYPNLVVLRSMSKGFGLAGLRLGYLIGCYDRVLKRLRALYKEKQVSRLSVKVATEVLRHRDYYFGLVKRTVRRGEWVIEKLRKMGLRVYFGETNFFVIDCDSPRRGDHCVDGKRRARDLVDLCLEKGIVVKPLGPAYGLARYVRVSIGTRTQMKAFLEVVEKDWL